jgi:hypothetical protein
MRIRFELGGILSLISFCTESEESEPMKVLSVCADADKAATKESSTEMKKRIFIEY